MRDDSDAVDQLLEGDLFEPLSMTTGPSRARLSALQWRSAHRGLRRLGGLGPDSSEGWNLNLRVLNGVGGVALRASRRSTPAPSPGLAVIRPIGAVSP